MVLLATGSRCSDAHLIKHRQIQELCKSGITVIFNVKSNKNLRKVISDEMKEGLQEAYNSHLGLLKAINIKPSIDQHVCLNFGSKAGIGEYQLLSRKKCNQSLNTHLNKFERYLTGKYGANFKFSTHSFRIAYITELLIKGMPLEQVSLTVGHSSILTTQLYNRHTLSVNETKEFLDKPLVRICDHR